MRRTGRSVWLWVGVTLLLSACSRQLGSFPASPAKPEAHSPLPFDGSSHSNGISPTEAFASASIPVGTVLVIRLESFLSSAGSQPGDQFQAVLDGPLVVQGQTLAPSGTAITGTVLAAQSSRPHEPGYLRLTLSTAVLNGKTLDLHTSSVFSKGGSRSHPISGSGAAYEIKFSTGRRLTFRLVQPLPLGG